MGIRGPAITIEPTTPTVKVAGKQTFTSNLPGVFKLSPESGGTLQKVSMTETEYTAGQEPGNDFIGVTDVSQPLNKAATEITVTE